ncbi:MAG: hypothetical protein QM820_45295 [Minicystis sp.]
MIEVGDPQAADDLEAPGAHGLQHRLPVFTAERGREAQLAPPHVLDRDGDAAIAIVSGVVEDLDPGKALRPAAIAVRLDGIPGLFEERPRALRRMGLLGERIDACRKVGGPRLGISAAGDLGNVMCRRDLASSGHPLHQRSLVDGEPQRASHPHVVERARPGVELEPVRRQEREAHQIALAREQGPVLGRDGRAAPERVERAHLEEAHRRVAVVDLAPYHLAEPDPVLPPVSGVRLHGDGMTEGPRLQREGAVVDEVLRPRPPLLHAARREGLHHVLSHRRERRARGEIEEVRRRPLQLHLEDEIRRRTHAQERIARAEVAVIDVAQRPRGALR